jgi:predicted S18 family serine protease
MHHIASGNEHPDTAATMNNIGLVLKATDRLGEAKTYYDKALDIQVCFSGVVVVWSVVCGV